MKKIILYSILAISMLGVHAQPASAHWHPGYSHDATIGYHNPNWMSLIRDDARLSELSIPGTHYSMAYRTNQPATDHVYTQSMPLNTQLNSGIRYLDIR
ncbi:hypothetical protein [Paenibacillus thiaminolyticus]|uniref:hypothetical protein n=1 Tax=Paenibacillus thiaminolyticus TaxID=49283 RepID=UPI0025434A48|nr:hypothetical protein [Paenibacillus thiaminolyticus]WII35187.1 hypothetical protein O0V01_15860 [Paenibacillus thiaminolyticus]